jgi:hypothetical protein
MLRRERRCCSRAGELPNDVVSPLVFQRSTRGIVCALQHLKVYCNIFDSDATFTVNERRLVLDFPKSGRWVRGMEVVCRGRRVIEGFQDSMLSCRTMNNESLFSQRLTAVVMLPFEGMPPDAQLV